MHMAVHDCLSGGLSTVHAHVEAFDRFVLGEHLQSHLIKKQINRAPLWVVEALLIITAVCMGAYLVVSFLAGWREGVSGK